MKKVWSIVLTNWHKMNLRQKITLVALFPLAMVLTYLALKLNKTRAN